MRHTDLILGLAVFAGCAGALARPPAWERAVFAPELAVLPLPMPAFTIPEFECAPPDGWLPLGTGQLDAMRGGFTTPQGLQITLGIERMISVNGNLVARTQYGLDALAGGASSAARGALTLIQNGPGNTYNATMDPAVFGATVIQNSLNDQTIRNQTVINATVNSASLLQALNFQDSLGQALHGALRPH